LRLEITPDGGFSRSSFDNVMVWTAPAPASGSEKGRAKMVVVEQPI
jgi:hypothetical protein